MNPPNEFNRRTWFPVINFKKTIPSDVFKSDVTISGYFTGLPVNAARYDLHYFDDSAALVPAVSDIHIWVYVPGSSAQVNQRGGGTTPGVPAACVNSPKSPSTIPVATGDTRPHLASGGSSMKRAAPIIIEIYSFFLCLHRFDGKAIAVPVVIAYPRPLALVFTLLDRPDICMYVVQSTGNSLYFTFWGKNVVGLTEGEIFSFFLAGFTTTKVVIY